MDFLIPATVFAVSTLLLCFYIGSAAHNFFALCGVGVSLLSLLATLSQPLVFWMACGVSLISSEWECDVPVALVWICSVLTVVGPVLSLCCMSCVLDELWGTRVRWRLITGAPVLLYVATVGQAVWSRAPNYTLFTYANYVSLATTGSLLGGLWNQKEFEMVWTYPKPHLD
ncbi:hypothetical protein STCU_06229 [Strigomonas culicis]|nr:hypothetical protein STCU_06229 [Strigomonas culicis]|eukprot:EPY26283.1 hypothetical protein STCU_06229 [Strigomonas culicis]